MRPEMPFLAAGAVALAGGVARDGGFPKNGTAAVIATVALVVVASATSGSAFAPVVRAIGLLILLAAVMAAVPAFTKKRK